MPIKHCLITLVTTASTLATGNLAVAAEDRNDALKLDRVVTIGDRSRSRTLIDSAVPVDVYSREDLQRMSGLGNELGEILAQINTSFQYPRQSNSVTSDHVRAASLRGMSPDQVLVLVNGRRRHPSAVVNDNTKIGRGTNAFDFNSIPLTAVERVEILRDGASAQYGSDAIAGVINIVLQEGGQGGEVGLSYGQHLTRVDPVDQRERDGETLAVHALMGHEFDDAGFVRYGFEYRDRASTNRAGFDEISPFLPQTEDNLAFQGQQTHRVGDPDSQEGKIWLRAGAPTGLGEWSLSLTAAEMDTEGAAVYRHPDSNQNVTALYPEGFQPVTTGNNRDLALSTSLSGLLGGWETDLSLSAGRNAFDFGVRNSLNPSLGEASPRRFEAGRYRLEQHELALDGLRDLRVLSRPSSLAMGVSLRHEAFASRAGEPASWLAGNHAYDEDLAEQVGFPDIGSQGAKGLTPEDATQRRRRVAAGFFDLSTDVTGRITTSVAARYEHYDDFGSTLTGKLGGRFRLRPGLSLRGSISNSFRAPSLSQTAWSRSDNTFGPEGQRVSSRLVRADSAIGQALGTAPLEEETARSASLGLTARVGTTLDLTADLFRIEVDDRITLSESLQDHPEGANSLEDQIGQLPGGEGVQALTFFSNAADTRTQGVEMTADWRPELALGKTGFNASISYIDQSIRSVGEASEAMRAINPDFELVGVAERNTLTTATPEWRAVLGGRWEVGRWTLNGRARYNSSVERVFAFASQRFSGETLFDVSMDYQLLKSTRLGLGAENLFDTYPDESEPANSFFGNFAYDPLNPAGVNGRFLYARATFRF